MIAIWFSPGESPDTADELETNMRGHETIPKQNHPSLGRVDRGSQIMWRIINALYEEYCQARLDEMRRLDAVK